MAAEMSGFTERELAVHEAGHAVLAVHFGLPVERVSIVAIPEARSHVKMAAQPVRNPAEQLVGVAGRRGGAAAA